MTRSPLLERANATTAEAKKPRAPMMPAENSGTAPTMAEAAGIFEKSAKLSQTPPTAAILTIEKLDQFRDDLVWCFFHQPVSRAFDKHALNIVRHHLALLDQERTAGFFS